MVEAYLRRGLDKGKLEERVAAVLKELLQSDDQSPRMRAMDNEPFK